MTRFVLVTAVKVDSLQREQSAAGIARLKRRVSLPQFIFDFMSARGMNDQNSALLKRDDAYTAVYPASGAADHVNGLLNFTFTEYNEEDLLSAVAHLSKEELMRDLKELLPLGEKLKWEGGQ